MELNINEMKPEMILRKEAFRRAKPLPFDLPETGGSADYNTNLNRSQIQYSYLSQDDFLREFNPESHQINSLKYYPNLLYMDKEQSGKYQAKVRSRVAVAWQRRIHTKRLVALTGYDPDISISRTKTDEASQEALKAFKEGWSLKGMDTAVHLAIAADGKVGDTALVGFKDNGKFGYRLFSYDKGDALYPHFDPMTGKIAIFGRRFKRDEYDDKGNKETIVVLDVWDETYYMQYREATSWEKQRGAGDWLVEVAPKPHKFGFCPVAYHRYGEPFWSASQSLIEQDELALSQLAENNAQYALRILYTMGAEFEMEGSTDGTPRLISSTDPNAKAGFLEPADSSSSYELQLKTLEKEIMRCSFCVETPELKSGSDLSSLTVKMLNADSYLKALDDSREYRGFLDTIKDIFIEGYGTESMKRAEFLKLNVVVKLQPWVFMSEGDVVNTLVQLVSIGVLSKRSATEYAYETLGLGSVDEADRVLGEAHDELVAQGKLKEQTTTVANPVNVRRNQAE